MWKTLMMMNLRGCLVGPEIDTVFLYSLKFHVRNLTKVLSPQMLMKETAFSPSSRMMTWTLQGMSSTVYTVRLTASSCVVMTLQAWSKAPFSYVLVDKELVCKKRKSESR